MTTLLKKHIPENFNVHSATNGNVTSKSSTIKNSQLGDVNRVALGNLNINSSPNKFKDTLKTYFCYCHTLF